LTGITLPYYYIKGSGKRVSLTDKNFVAKGGEASVYAVGGTAYRVYHDPTKAIDAQKIKELSALDIPEIVRPVSELLDSRKHRCGETMPFVKNAYVLCQLFTNSFRRKNKITNEHVVDISDAMLRVVPHCHTQGVMLVDPNETNWLVPHSLDTVRLIDTSCCQTPSFPGTAIKLAIQDVHTKGFTPESDYFSLAVVLGWLWVGIHPYLAFNRAWTGMDANAAMIPRMKANISFFDPQTEFNRACRPLEEIPASLSAWLYAVLSEGKRIPPPLHVGDAVASVVIAVSPVSTSAITVVELETAAGDIMGVFGDAVCVEPEVVIGYTPLKNTAVTARIVNGTLSLSTNIPIEFSCQAEHLFECDSRIYVVSSGSVSEVVFNELGNGSIRATVNRVGAVADIPTTKTYPGCVVQNLLGRYLLSIFPESGKCIQHQLRDLDGWQILGAKYERGVFCAMAESGGKYKLVVYRMNGADSLSGEVLSSEFCDVNFAVTSHGVCALLDHSGTLHAFRNKPGTPVKEIKQFPNPDMQLFSRGAHIVGALGKALYRVSLG